MIERSGRAVRPGDDAMARLMRQSRSTKTLLAALALTAAGLTPVSPVSAQSAAACDAARQEGRTLPGRSGIRRPPRGGQPPGRPGPSARRPAALTPGAAAMRNALAATSWRDWTTTASFLVSERLIFALGSTADMRVLAEAGNARAQYLMGRAHEFGQFATTLDQAQAIGWYRRASAGGEPKAQFTLGYMYGNGQGVPLDYGRAMALYRQAAEQNYGPALSNISHLYDGGFGVAQDHGQAVYWARRGADVGDATAQRRLGIFLYQGLGTPQNRTEGLIWLRRAAAAGDDFARNYLTERNLSLQ